MILVFGATGYVGRYLCPYLVRKGYDVLALGRSEKGRAFLENHGVKFAYFDMADPKQYETLPEEGVNAIINLSAVLAELEAPVEDFFSVNALGTYHILEYARQHNIDKVVIASTHKVQNDLDKEIISTDDPISFKGPHSPYIISKIAAENFATWYNKDFGMHACVLRFTGVHGYGEMLGQLDNDGTYQKTAFEVFFEKALKGESIEVWGDQTIKRDHIYIKDVLTAIEKTVLSKKARGIYYLASGVGHNQYEEAVVLSELLRDEGRSEVILRPDKKGLERGYIYDISRLKEDTGWEPEFIDTRKMLTDYIAEWKTKEYRNFHIFKDSDRPATY